MDADRRGKLQAHEVARPFDPVPAQRRRWIATLALSHRRQRVLSGNPQPSPAGARWRRLAAHLLRNLRLEGAAFRLHELLKARRLARDARAQFLAPAADGLPLPPPSHIVLVGGDTNVPAFLAGGVAVVDAMREMLAGAGANLAECRSILDFGCGCGRVMRQLRAEAAGRKLRGTDYNERLIAWCRENLAFAQFDVNNLNPPLAYASGEFDLIYAFSVFTHLPQRLQVAWMRELARTLRPGGHLFITVHGDTFVEALDADERSTFAAGDLVVRHARNAGSNLCTAFHPRAYLQRLAAPDLEIVAHASARLGQDALLLRKLHAAAQS